MEFYTRISFVSNRKIAGIDEGKMQFPCQEEASITFWKCFSSITVGSAAVATGLALTASTGGAGAMASNSSIE